MHKGYTERDEKMENIAYIGLSHQNAIKTQMNVTANNIANMTTPGFKSQGLLFQEYVTTTGKNEKVSQVIDYGTYRRTEQGVLTSTNNQLDMALQGDGFFTVQTPAGPRYTRAGNFTLNSQNQIVNPSGYPLLNDVNAPIEIPVGNTKITITSNGSISTESGEIAKIKLAKFENEQELTASGNNLYNAKNLTILIAEDVQVKQGMIEGSNVQPILEMNKMIEALRQYQSVQKMLQTDHERQRSTIGKLTRVQ